MIAARFGRWCRPALGMLIALLLAACTGTDPSRSTERSPTSGGAARQGGAMTVAVTADAVSFHPYKTTDAASRDYQSLVYANGLLSRDPHNPDNFIPELAESWSLAEDRVTYTFRLRPDIRWSDGQPITSADFKWTFEQARRPENAYPYVSNFDTIAAYEAPDPRTIVVTLKEPLAVGLENADAVVPLPKHIWEKLDWNDPNRNPEIMAPTVVSGPFKLKEWVRDSHAIFVANDLYFKGRPKLDTYEIRVVGTPQMAFQKLRAGEVDQASIPPEDYEQAKRLDHITVYEWWPAAATWSYIGFNLRKPYLQDVTVRRALAHAVDRQLIIDKIQYGLAQPTYSAFTPTCWCYNPDVPRYDYDPARARALLAQAGWVPGPDNVLTKDGQRLRLRLLFGPNSNKVRERIATVVQEEFRKLGVEVEIQGLEWAAFLQAIKSPPFDWDLVVLGWVSTVDPHWMYQVWAEQNIPQLNAGAYVNKRVEELFKQGAREFDRERRKQIYQEIQRILAEDVPYIFLTMNKAYTGISNRIGGVEVSPLGIGYNIEQWYVK
ncbi:MAG TPA: ABC transporter substrate-binding protein [Chloroflexota bacterium]|nr:ABC transporter substrate-binding protein [Chloroflexota bacterium]